MACQARGLNCLALCYAVHVQQTCFTALPNPFQALRPSVSTSVAESAAHRSLSKANRFPCSSKTLTVVMEASVAYQCLVLQKRCESSERCFAPQTLSVFMKQPVVFCSMAFIRPETSEREISLLCVGSPFGLWGSPGSWYQYSSPSRLWKETNSRKSVMRCCVAEANPTRLCPSEDMGHWKSTIPVPGKIVCWLP